MRTVPLVLAATATVLFMSAATPAQEIPQPGPEHAKLKQLEGTWDAVVKFGTDESKGTMTYKMDLGGLWLVSDYQGEFAGQPFRGKGLDSYDPAKKKYVSVWVDSMSVSPMISEGTFDKDGKVLTLTGEGPGADGKPTKLKTVTEHKDKDTMLWTMFGTGPDGKEGPMLSITYKRRK